MYSVYEVRNNDSISSIADIFGISEEELIALNKANFYPGNFIVVPNTLTYEIKKGDNLYMIAKKYGISLDELISLNGLDKEDYIYPGEILKIPKNNNYITKEGDTIKDILKFSNIEDLLNKNSEIYLVPNQIIFYTKEY